MSSGGWQNGSNSSSSSNSSSDYGTGRFRPYANGSSSNNVNASDQGFSFPVEPIQNPLSAYSADLGSGNANTLELAGIPSNVQGISAEDLNLEDIEIDQEQTDVVEAVRGLIRFAGLRYLTTIIANPFQIAQTLLQVQYNPNDARGDVEYSQSDINEEELFSDNPNVYRSAERKAGGPQSIYDPDGLPQGKAKVDHDGYVISVSEDKSAALRPAYQLSTLPGGKVRVLKRLVSHPTEGVLSPFKGTFTKWSYDMLRLLLQPTLEALLNESFGIYDSSSPFGFVDSATPNALTLVASSMITGWILSPLELVRTRLMIQSGSPIHRKYSGMMDALRKVYREEGGFSGMYLSSINAIPALVQHALEPVFQNLGPVFIERCFGIDPYDQPISFNFSNFLWKTLHLVVIMPIDTVRKRLQAQIRYKHKITDVKSGLSTSSSFRTVVRTSPIQYTGMVNCTWRIITEEGDPNYHLRASRQAGSYYDRYPQHPPYSNKASDDAKSSPQPVGHPGVGGRWGLRGLYPGFAMQLLTNTGVLGLKLLTFTETNDGSF